MRWGDDMPATDFCDIMVRFARHSPFLETHVETLEFYNLFEQCHGGSTVMGMLMVQQFNRVQERRGEKSVVAAFGAQLPTKCNRTDLHEELRCNSTPRRRNTGSKARLCGSVCAKDQLQQNARSPHLDIPR